MSGRRFGHLSAYLERFKRGAPTAPDERAATIERLEQALADEREAAASLQRAHDNLTFQIEVLEKGYAKQLEAARERAEEAEGLLAKRDAELTDLTYRHETTTESLAAAQDELQRVTAQRDRLRRQIDGDPEPDEAEDTPGPPTPEGTINRLMAIASRPRRKLRTADELPPSDAGKHESVSGEMLSPELLLSKKHTDDS